MTIARVRARHARVTPFLRYPPGGVNTGPKPQEGAGAPLRLQRGFCVNTSTESDSNTGSAFNAFTESNGTEGRYVE